MEQTPTPFLLRLTPLPKPRFLPPPLLPNLKCLAQPPLEGQELRLVDRFRNEGWNTDFERRTISYSAVLSGGVRRDGIPSIDNPLFATVSQGLPYLEDMEPVVAVEYNGEAKAYSLNILTRHEIVNDELGGKKISVTYCPLCNSAIVFDRIVDGRELTFGVSGKLRNSDLIMYDRQTESWWQQFTGEALAGEYADPQTSLDVVPSYITSWLEFKRRYSDGLALRRDPGYPESSYLRPFYAGYDSSGLFPFLFRGEVDDVLGATDRVLSIEVGEALRAYSWEFLTENPVLNDELAGQKFVTFFDDGTLSSFRTENLETHASGSAAAFIPEARGMNLTFMLTDNGIVDTETGTVWSSVGKALEGELSGESLQPVVHGNHFWFAWNAFAPDAPLVTAATPAS